MEIPLFGFPGHKPGLMAIMDGEQISNPPVAKPMLQISAVRAAAELERERMGVELCWPKEINKRKNAGEMRS